MSCMRIIYLIYGILYVYAGLQAWFAMSRNSRHVLQVFNNFVKILEEYHY